MLLRKNDSGRSIVEMLGVLAIMGVITVMGIAGYSQAISKINRNKTVEQITKIAQEVRGVFAGRKSYNKDDTTADQQNIGADILEKMGINLETPYGGKYSVVSVNSAANNPGFHIKVPNVAAQDCLYFATMSWTDAMKPDISEVSDFAYVDNDVNNTAANCKADGSSTIDVFYR